MYDVKNIRSDINVATKLNATKFFYVEKLIFLFQINKSMLDNPLSIRKNIDNFND